ncbi:Avirulence protein (Avh) [Phytophthora palmivora]|uniref:Avirulence protein (Avh) n=1 Tax=Phytophthora palmivora TaxID=4796 RepID=A0A2P4WWQ3_9STRA|nr:Avirulence protein (Avh) [Phytophthora palmivora]
MGAFGLIVLVVVLTCVRSSSAILLKVTPPPSDHLFTESQRSDEHMRLLRTYKSTENTVEDRVSLGTLTEAMKSTTSKIQMNFWLKKQKSGYYVLKKLQLGNNIETVLENTKLDMLWKYVERFNKQNPTKQISVVDSLIQRYGDDAVMKMLVSAKQAENTKDVATKLETELFQGWFRKGKSADEVFMLLKLRSYGYTALSNGKLEILANYVKFVNGELNQKNSLVDVLTKGFGGEKIFVSLFASAKRDKLTMKKAKEWETVFLNQQLDDRMRLLKLDDDLITALSSPDMKQLTRYVSTLSKTYQNKDISLIGRLEAHYGDAVVAKTLVQAKRIESTRGVATRLQTEQFNAWKKNDKSTDDVFELLNLKKLKSLVFYSRGFDTLEDYIKFVTPAKLVDKTLIGTLSRCFGGEDELAILIVHAKPHSQTKAMELQNKLFQQWRDEGLDSMSVLTKKFNAADEAVASPVAILTAENFKAFLKSKSSVHMDANGVNPREVRLLSE